MIADFQLNRKAGKADRTLGVLLLPDSTNHGYILEDQIRPGTEYVHASTAIKAGRYRMIITFSDRFKRPMIQLINGRGNNMMFGGRSIDACGIRIHGGNGPADTEGCPLLGANINKPTIEEATMVSNCKDVVESLFQLVKKMNETQEVYITITDPIN